MVKNLKEIKKAFSVRLMTNQELIIWDMEYFQ